MQPGATSSYKVCPQCRQPATVEAQFCSRCGMSFVQGAPMPPQPPNSQVPATFLQHANSKRVTAGICGILLGSLGIHKFVLGYTTPGVIMLLISAIGGWVTCGISASVMGLIGLIEGILYLTKSDQQFYDEYIVGKREWF